MDDKPDASTVGYRQIGLLAALWQCGRPMPITSSAAALPSLSDFLARSSTPIVLLYEVRTTVMRLS